MPFSVLNNFFIPQSHIFRDSRCLGILPGGVSKIISEHVKMIKYVEDGLSNVLSVIYGPGGCEQGVSVALTFCMGACDAWHVTGVMSSWLAHLVHCHHPASLSDQMTTNCHQSQKNSGKISTRIIFVRQTGVIYTSHTRAETVQCE